MLTPRTQPKKEHTSPRAALSAPANLSESALCGHDMLDQFSHGFSLPAVFCRYKPLAETLPGGTMLSAEEKCQLALQQCKLPGWQVGDPQARPGQFRVFWS